jgi:hypothetical protein
MQGRISSRLGENQHGRSADLAGAARYLWRRPHRRVSRRSASGHTAAFASGFLRLCGRDQRHGRLGGEVQEGKGFLQVEVYRGVGVVGVADGNILANVQ